MENAAGPHVSILGDGAERRVTFFSTNRGASSASLAATNKKGIRRLTLSHSEKATTIILSDMNNQMRSEFGFWSGPPGLILFGPGFNPRLELAVEPTGSPVIRLHDPAKNKTTLFR